MNIRLLARLQECPGVPPEEDRPHHPASDHHPPPLPRYRIPPGEKQQMVQMLILSHLGPNEIIFKV